MKKQVAILLALIFLLSFNIVAFADDGGWPDNPNNVTVDTNKDSENENTSGDTVIDTNSDDVERVDTGKSTDVFSEEDLRIDAGDEGRRIYASYQDTIPKVSIDDAIEWANRKGFEIIYFLQVIVQPFAIIVFIISAFLTLLGSISNGAMAGKGVWGMIISSIMYAVVLYAPVIMQTFVGWATS